MTELVPHTVAAFPERADAGARRWVELMAPAVELAKHVANTHFVPPGLRGRPDAIVAAVMYGDELGLGPMRSLSWVSIIDGRPSIAAEGYRALVLAAGHSMWPVESTITRCVMAGKRAGEDRVVEITWTMDDAKRAGLAGKNNWRAYPRQMLIARATADLARLLFADVLGGVAMTEEYAEDSGTETPPSGAGAGGSAPSGTRRRRRSPEPPTPPPPVVEAPPPPAAVGASEPPSPNEEGEATSPPASPPEPIGEDPAAALLAAAEEDTRTQQERDADAEIERMSAEADRVISREKALAERAREAAAETPMMSEGQRAKLHALMREKGVESRDAKLAYVSTVTGREITTSNELTEEEAGRVIDELTQWNPQDPKSKPFREHEKPPPYDPNDADIPY